MLIQIAFKKGILPALLVLSCGLQVIPVTAQTSTGAPASSGSTVQMPAVSSSSALKTPLAQAPSDIHCAGFIEYAPSPNQLEIVGGEQEQEQRVYSEGDQVFINAGVQRGVQLGQEFVIVRPRGQFTSKLTKKKGWLGVYTQEVGRVRVTTVRDQVSVAVVSQSCETILLGDLLRAAPSGRAAQNLDGPHTINRFADSSRKQVGRIVLARDGRELLSKSQVVFIDLGAEDGIKTGDQLTIFRPAGAGNITRFRDEEVTPAASGGFESERFKGGKFSNKAPRVKRPNDTGVYGPVATTPDVKRHRPPVPRKIVGDLVVLDVQKRTATAVVSKVAQEIHTGDFVELQ